MIYDIIPYSLDKNIGKAYNDCMRLLPNDTDWACLRDRDTQFMTPDYGHQLQDIVDQHPDTGLFTCYTNRVGNPEQCYNSVISEVPDMLHHQAIAKRVSLTHRWTVKELTGKISGMLMLIRKDVWKAVGGFDEHPGKMLTVDETFSLKILNSGRKILLMEGIYLFHFYRLDKDIHNTSHLE